MTTLAPADIIRLHVCVTELLRQKRSASFHELSDILSHEGFQYLDAEELYQILTPLLNAERPPLRWDDYEGEYVTNLP